MNNIGDKLNGIITSNPKLYNDYLSDVFFKLEMAYKKLDEKYSDNSYKINLSNGENVAFSINSSGITHLLGLDVNKIRSNSYFKCENLSAQDIIKTIIHNKNDIIKDLVTKKISSNVLRFDKIVLKCNTFLEMNDIGLNNIQEVIRFDCGRLSTEGNHTNCDVDYYLSISTKNNKKAYLGLKKHDEYNNYYVKTLMVDIDPNIYLKNQILVLPGSLTVKDINWNIKEQKMTDVNKLKMLKKYLDISKNYCMSIDVTTEYANIMSYKVDDIYTKDENNHLKQVNGNLVNVNSKLEENIDELKAEKKRLLEKNNILESTKEELINKNIDLKNSVRILEKDNKMLKNTQSKVKVLFKKLFK